MHNKHIVILGCGFGGLALAKSFGGKKGYKVTIVDKNNHHLFQPLLYQVATSGLSAEEIAQPIRSILSDYENITILMDRILDFDLDKKQVVCHKSTIEYDYLVVALGGQTSYFGNNHWAEHAPGLKSLEDALQIRRQVLSGYELAENEPDTQKHDMQLTTVVVGAGPTGVEMAGSIAELSKQVLKGEFRNIDSREARILLLEGGDRVLPGMPKSLSKSALQQLQDLGVEVLLNTFVKDIRHHEVDIEGKTIHAHNIIWATGIEANTLTKKLNTDLDRSGKIKVTPHLQLKEHKNVFAIGDIVNLVDIKGVHVPGVSPAAIQMGQYVHKYIISIEKGKQIKGYKYWDKGMMATIGRSKAVCAFAGIKVSGFLAWLAWLFVHLIFLVGFKNKISVFLQWLYSYFSFNRGARIILDPEED